MTWISGAAQDARCGLFQGVVVLRAQGSRGQKFVTRMFRLLRVLGFVFLAVSGVSWVLKLDCLALQEF